MATLHEKRLYEGVLVGFGIRRQIGLSKIYRMRRGNGFYGAELGKRYQDKYNYFVPGSINNAAGALYRIFFAAAILAWQTDLSASEKKEYQSRASRGLRMSGYNLFIREVMNGIVSVSIDKNGSTADGFVTRTELCATAEPSG